MNISNSEGNESLDEYLIGMSDKTIMELNEEEVVTKHGSDHVVMNLGTNGHVTINPDLTFKPDLSPSCHLDTVDEVFVMENFSKRRDRPVSLGCLEDHDLFVQPCEVPATEDMLIKLKGSETYMLPTELSQFTEPVQKAVNCFHAITPHAKDYYCYVSVITMLTPPGSYQSFKTIHADGLLGSKHRDVKGNYSKKVPIFFSVASAIPTEFFVQSIDVSRLSTDVHDYSKFFNAKVDVDAWSPKPFELVMWDGYTLHRSARNDSSSTIKRTFLRIEYSDRLYDSDGATQNEAFKGVQPQLVHYGRPFLSACGGWQTKCEPKSCSPAQE